MPLLQVVVMPPRVWPVPRSVVPDGCPRVIGASSWSEMHAVARSTRIDVAIVDPYIEGRCDTIQVRRFNAAFPSIGIVAAAQFDAKPVVDVIELARAGVSSALRWRDCRPAELARVVRSVARPSATATFIQLCETRVYVQLNDLVAGFMGAPAAFRSLRDVEKYYGRHGKTLRAHLRAERLPAPRRFVQWMRLVSVVALLEDGGRSTRGAAHAAGFRSGAELAGVARRYAGVGLRALATASAPRIVLDAFIAERARLEASETMDDRVASDETPGRRAPTGRVVQ